VAVEQHSCGLAVHFTFSCLKYGAGCNKDTLLRDFQASAGEINEIVALLIFLHKVNYYFLTDFFWRKECLILHDVTDRLF
jgi:hypothetical protein